MITCYMDILGFSDVASENKKYAFEKVKMIKEKINNEINYVKLLDKSNYNNNLSFSHFENLTFTSDSIIITGDNTLEFYRQLGLFICDIFTKSSNYIFKGYNYESFIKEVEYLSGDITESSFLKEIADSTRVSSNCDFELLNNAVLLQGAIRLTNENVAYNGEQASNNKNVVIGPSIITSIDDIPNEINFLFKDYELSNDESLKEKEFLWPYYSLVETETDDLDILYANFEKATKNLLHNAYVLISKALKSNKENNVNDRYCNLARVIIKSLKAFKEKINCIIATTNSKTKKNLKFLEDIDKLILKFKQI